MIKICLYSCLFFGLFCQTAHTTRLKLALEWLINPHHAPLIVALSQGFFEEEGLEIELIQGPGALEGCINVSAGVVDLALTNEAQWMIQKDKGLQLEPVLILINQPLEVFMSRVPLNELKGKRIGHSSSGVGFSAAVLTEILAQQGLSVKDVTPVHTKYSLVRALISGQVDAIMNVYGTYAAVDLKQYAEKFPATFIVYPYENLGVPLFAAQMIVAHPKISLPTRQRLKRALTKACQFLKNNPDQAWKVFSSYRLELDTAANKDIWTAVLHLFNVEEPERRDSKRTQKLKKFLIHHQLVKE